MAITTFDNYISKEELKTAKAFYLNNTIAEVIEGAKEEDKKALSILFYVCRAVIADAFFKSFLGDRKYWARRIANGDDHLFASEVYAMLATSAAEKKGILFKFNPGKVGAFTDAEVLKRFQYYMWRYCMALAKTLNRAEKKGGLGGYAKKDAPAPEFVSIKDAGSDAEATGEIEIATPDSFVDEYEAQDTASRYLKKLKDTKPKLYDLVLLKTKGADKQEVMEKLGIDSWTYHHMLRQAKEIFQAFTA